MVTASNTTHPDLINPVAKDLFGIFDNNRSIYATYRVGLQFRGKLMGGAPKDPAIIPGFLASRAELRDEPEELRRATKRTLVELGLLKAEDAAEATAEQLELALKSIAGEKMTVGFKCDSRGLYVESRQIQAMLKEAVAVLFPWPEHKWGVTKKTPRAFFAERVVPEPDRVLLGRTQADGIELFIGHPSGPTRKTSTLTYYEYCEDPTIAFDLYVLRDYIPETAWPDIWTYAGMNGFGALRSQSFGKFKVTQWDRG
jgi:hypothetical protein